MIGKILWWDSKYGKGIVEDQWGNEYYIDSSVLADRAYSEKLKSKMIVEFVKNEEIKHPWCGKDVRIIE